MPPPRRHSARAAPALVALAAALAAPWAARAHDEPASGGALRITASPPVLLLGRDAAAALTVAAPPEVEALELTASVGRVDEVRRLPGGGFTARYRPAGERYPQVAIVAAVARTGAGMSDGWLAIPLFGQGDAKVPAPPGTRVELRIGDRTFGPRAAGADGLAVIPVVVPPGVREGHHGFRPVDLRIPETPLVHAVLERSTVLADREERVRFVAYGVAPHGAARRGDAPIVEASRGILSLQPREAGVVAGVWTLPPGRAGEERLVVRLPSAPTTRAVLRLRAAAGAPAIVAVSFERDAFVAGVTETVAVTARALDAGGNGVPAQVALETDAGRLEDVREPEPGRVEARLRLTSFEGRREARVTASLPALGISGSRALPLRPGGPAQAAFAAGDDVARGDGRRVEVVRLEVSDRFGNPVDGAPTVTADRGRVLGLDPAGVGRWDVRYVAPAVEAAGPERILAAVGPVRAEVRRTLLPPEPRWALAPSAGVALDVRGRFAGLRSGVAVERHVDRGAPPLELALRAEADVLDAGAGQVPAFLAGASAARALGPRLVLRGSLSGGLAAWSGGAAPAARIGIGAGWMRGRVEPFVEAAALVAGRGEPGAFAVVGLGAGIRVGLESR